MKETTTKQCPMRPYQTNTLPPKTEFSPCIGENCAWYTGDRCALAGVEEAIYCLVPP